LGDDLLARLRRNALVCGLAMSVAAVVIARDLRAGFAVLGGGLLIGISFLSLSGGIEDVAAKRRPGRALLKVAGRYALLAFLAYVMIARLRLPPLGLIAGASSVVAAAGVEAVRLLLKKTNI
jgi:hypothetical protein